MDVESAGCLYYEIVADPWEEANYSTSTWEWPTDGYCRDRSDDTDATTNKRVYGLENSLSNVGTGLIQANTAAKGTGTVG